MRFWSKTKHADKKLSKERSESVDTPGNAGPSPWETLYVLSTCTRS